MITDKELEELEALCEKATSGPWEYVERGEYYRHDEDLSRDVLVTEINGPYQCDTYFRSEDAKFIAASRTAVPKLIDEVKRLKGNLSCVGIHTCHEECENPFCLLRRENEQYKQAVEVMAEALTEVEDSRNRTFEVVRAQQALNHEAVKKVLK